MDFFQMVSFAKLFSKALGMDRTVTLTEAEMDAACEALKSMADTTTSWSNEEKEIYKAMVDFAKDTTSK